MARQQDREEGRHALLVGAGIGGLATAVALKQIGWSVAVYEAAPELRPVGAGILLAPNAMQVLSRLGCAEAATAAGYTLSGGMQVTDRHLSPLGEIDGFDERELFGQQSTAIHRGALQGLLLDALGSEHVHTGKRCKQVSQDAEGVTLLCDDGTEAKGDILLGADGINSQVREFVKPGVKLRYSGETCWRGVAELKPDKELRGRGYEMWGGGARLGIIPISDERVYWFSTIKTEQGGKDESPAAIKQILLDRFKDFAGPAMPVLEATPAESIMRHDLCDFPPQHKWSAGRIALLGDAAHATTPNMGQGGCQALEDAWALQLVFKQHQDPEEAFAAYEKMRQEKAHYVVVQSYRFGKMAQLKNPLLCWLRNLILKLTPPKVIHKQLKQLYRIPG